MTSNRLIYPAREETLPTKSGTPSSPEKVPTFTELLSYYQIITYLLDISRSPICHSIMTCNWLIYPSKWGQFYKSRSSALSVRIDRLVDFFWQNLSTQTFPFFSYPGSANPYLFILCSLTPTILQSCMHVVLLLGLLLLLCVGHFHLTAFSFFSCLLSFSSSWLSRHAGSRRVRGQPWKIFPIRRTQLRTGTDHVKSFDFGVVTKRKEGTQVGRKNDDGHENENRTS